MEPLRVSILARDPLTGEGIASYLRNSPVLRVLPPTARQDSDICVVIDGDVNSTTWRRLERAAEGMKNPGMRMVLIANTVSPHHLQRARRWGVACLVHRDSAVREHVVQAVFAAGSSIQQAPDATQSPGLIGPTQTPRTSAGLKAREVKVVRLLADGLSTAEVAQQLNFSERTIRNIISGLLTRLDLRNRTHAVAYALQHGVLG
ncbi:response regulator transcription factor [Streptomyces cacaoi]|uniref:helix-turn-helix transcriptional regulator n=1 Tax=Streptomyces cacaoi TaxID=1898 RepID=UPI003748A04D